ncbi:isochorismate lyase [Acaryochloris marina]|uniref:Endoribonuclease L-PSP/chorismate mutase n=1 Tax=Acaryochloris marina (strain MBIC 11017) TaxID=329726 RepID=B0C242_ACAM1|nr:isochorismate lyase [Acaryochloris marina]ABW27343.1 endoribonuclease L-PSP/chorismate mutase [Acaryochloris marina MBIC11017]
MTQPIQRVSSGAPWEAQVGYCRAMQVGDQIHVSGTAPVDAQGQVVSADGYTQAHRCLEIIQAALQDLGTDTHAVVRTRMFVTDITQWQQFSQAHQEFFGAHPPVTTMVQVSALIDPAMLIEIEADAVVPADSAAILDAQDCRDMTDIRDAIDHLDAQVIALLGQRFEYVKAAAKFKTDAHSVQAPERLKKMLAQRRQWAENAGLEPDVIEQLYCNLVQYFINAELDHWRSSQ